MESITTFSTSNSCMTQSLWILIVTSPYSICGSIPPLELKVGVRESYGHYHIGIFVGLYHPRNWEHTWIAMHVPRLPLRRRDDTSEDLPLLGQPVSEFFPVFFSVHT